MFVYNLSIISQRQACFSVTEYSKVAAIRYRQYIRQKQKESLLHQLVILILRILHIPVRILEQASIKKPRRVEKINVEQEEK
jgi:hypothetical protein